MIKQVYEALFQSLGEATEVANGEMELAAIPWISARASPQAPWRSGRRTSPGAEGSRVLQAVHKRLSG